MKQFVGKFVCGSALLALVAWAAPVAAQDAPKVDVGVGYQWLHAPEQSYPFGLNADVSGALAGTVRWVGEIGWSRDASSVAGLDATLNAVSYGAGLRWAPVATAYKPYAQVVLGAQRDSVKVDGSSLGVGAASASQTTFILQPGVGATFPVGKAWGAFGQADWRRIFYSGNGENDFRVVVGVRVDVK